MSTNAYQTNIEIRYRDTDSMGHVSSPVYYDYMQSAYLAYMHDLLSIPTSEKLPHIMVKTECSYIGQAKYGDVLVVISRVTKFGGKSFEMEHVMHLDNDERTVVAKAASVHVMYDYASQSTYPVPAEFKQKVYSYQGEEQYDRPLAVSA